MNLLKKVVAVLLSAYLLGLSLSAPLSYRKSKKQLKHIRKRYLFVDKRIFYQEPSSVIQRRLRRDVAAQDASPCPYTTYETPTNFNEIPSSLVVAECLGCPHTCHALEATVFVLVGRGRDWRTWDRVYGYEQRTITVGYSYDPSKKPKE
ncbi:uncharacterized protein LOC110254833 [Exaiptasia diaphana]|uniref:Uncharacterized protein n=1 Tax=Exaiptasia diaphana TaxID=2652724 RepID=A0A913YCB8_EXADI|nr:uncharacterized protein LOC110254833 [Exaiptasia diaphana]KXJ19466.1 hypothetical protein AC249_AIPGENE1126 [Exaiptasia diaphana]